MLTVQQIINEVDALVPNTFDIGKKITWINELNREFFEIVKIPAVHKFVTANSQTPYIMPNGVRSYNVDRVLINLTIYKSMQHEEANPGHSYWLLDDATKELSLNPRPSIAGEVGLVRYSQMSKTTFLTTNLTAPPDAPEEYHWTYVLGLAERVAKGMNDVTLANNYGNDYRAQLVIAQQNYNARSSSAGN